MGPKFFLGGITWAQLYFCGYIVGPKIFFVGVSGDVIVNKKNFRCGFDM